MITTTVAGIFYLLTIRDGFVSQIEFPDAKACLTVKNRLLTHHKWKNYVYIYCISRETGEEVE